MSTATTAIAVPQRKTTNVRAAASPAYETAFVANYEKYYTRVFAFVYSRVRDVELSKDVMSDVFERAYRKGDSVRDKSAYRGWLFTIAKNLIAGHFRRAKVEIRKQERVAETYHIANDTVDPEDEAVRNDRAGALMKLVERLSDRDRELISLKFDSELTHDEIARITGMTSGNVRVAIFRALKRLKAMLQCEEAAALVA